MNPSIHRACVLSGFGCITLFVLGFWIVAGFVPPPSPDLPAQEIADFFRDNATRIRVGLVIAAFAAALLGPWVAAVSVHLKEIEGHRSPLTYLQLGFGMLLVLEFIFPIMVWQATTFRADRSPESIQLLNDVAWIPFEGVVSTGVVQCVAVAIAILSDRRANRTFPRWVGYLNVWVGLAFAGGAVNMFFKTGPLSWPGILAWWMPLGAFAVWLVVMSVFMLRYAGDNALTETGTAG